jgi:hypothetical protein
VRNPDKPGGFEEGIDLAFGVAESESLARNGARTRDLNLRKETSDDYKRFA